MPLSVSAAVSAFGKNAKSKLHNAAIAGQPEDQLRHPIEVLFGALADCMGWEKGRLTLIGETALGDLKVRPDFAVSIRNALVGFIEVKAPGKGFDPRKFKDPHDKDQWRKLKALPNLLYTDGNGFSLWRDGELIGKAEFDGNVETSGADLAAPANFQALMEDFLGWTPIPPRKAKGLAGVAARLCRLLRDEVTEQMENKNASLTGLAEDWRRLLFPNADNAEFADGYAQAVTFGLLMARARDIDLRNGIDAAAKELRKTNSLIGTALRLLTDDASNMEALKTSLGTLTRVLGEINWHVISKDKPEAWLYFYEDFLEIYDNRRRKQTGSYYTPPEVVSAMVRLTDEALRGPLFERKDGFAHDDVTVADPAVGTGTFLLGVLRQIALSVEQDLGAGAVAGAVDAAAKRLIGFELQFGPFAVAQLRLIAEFQSLMQSVGQPSPKLPDLRLYITDTLGNPYVEDEHLMQIAEPIAASRREANKIKKAQPIMVVIGNPPYKEKAKGRGAWIESGSAGRPSPLDWWQPPAAWRAGAHSKHLRNLYVYFWRWAAWKVFGSGHGAATGEAERDEEGIVSFITVAGFLNGPGFQRMRVDLRASCSDIWVIDCSPDGHQPEAATRIFQGVQQPVCIVLAARKKGKARTEPARVRFQALPKGRREVKFAALATLNLGPDGWEDCASEWREPFLPKAEGVWADFPRLKDFFIYDGSGVMPGRTWVIAPDRETLERRWSRLVDEQDAVEKERLFHPHKSGDKTSTKIAIQGLRGHQFREMSVAADQGLVVQPIRYAFRTFDRQWIIPDSRLINRPNPKLWDAFSDRQIYLTVPEDRTPGSGPVLSVTSLIPDMHHYHGRGGRVYPLWRGVADDSFNVSAAILELLSEAMGRIVLAEDVFAYLAAILAHPAFTARFAEDLQQPGLRVPLTADRALFDEAAAIGRRVVWLHTYGERFFDKENERPKGAPRKAGGPTVPVGGAILGAPEPLPDEMRYDAAARRLHIGKGHVDHVSSAVFAYEISGKTILKQWFSSRRLNREKPMIGDRRPPSPLSAIQPDHWLAEYTSDLIDLLHVLTLLTEMEPLQAGLMSRILESPLIDRASLMGDEAEEESSEEVLAPPVADDAGGSD